MVRSEWGGSSRPGVSRLPPNTSAVGALFPEIAGGGRRHGRGGGRGAAQGAGEEVRGEATAAGVRQAVGPRAGRPAVRGARHAPARGAGPRPRRRCVCRPPAMRSTALTNAGDAGLVDTAAAMGHIHLGEQKSISRLHARVQWNAETCGFEVLCLGKNGMFAAGKFVPKDQTVALSSKMPLKIGGARVYFVAALRSTCSTMSGAKMVHRVGGASSIGHHGGIVLTDGGVLCPAGVREGPRGQGRLEHDGQRRVQAGARAVPAQRGGARRAGQPALVRHVRPPCLDQCMCVCLSRT